MQLANKSHYLYKFAEIRESKRYANTEVVKQDVDFLSWCKRVSPQYDFTYDWIKYVENEQNKYNITLFSIPPQHGKSTVFTIHKAAYRLIHEPKHRGIIISYNVDITARFHREILQILENEGVQLYSKSQKEIVLSNRIGSISFCGFQGGITSKPAEWIIIDDPIRNAQDAYSTNYQEILWSGFSTSIFSRLQEKSKLEITQTRWHDCDLIGQIITKDTELGLHLKYKYINLPAICDTEDDPLGRTMGQVLCPQRFSLETIKTKMLLAEGDGYALYQGRPAPPEGAMFKSNDIETQTFINLEDIPKSTVTFISVDCAFKDTSSSDFVAIGVYKYHQNSGILFKINTINKKLDFDATVNECESLLRSYKCQFALVEDKANGSAVINVLNKKFPGKFIAINPEGGKISRAYAAQPFIKTKRFKIYKNMPNYNEYINQLKTFPKGTHDDMVDETTQAINYICAEYSALDFMTVSQNMSLLNGVRF
jgi:predicted phage terminase large subunit-like protein